MNWLRRRDRELAQELESHIEEKIADLVDAGVPESEARAQALREFGNITRYREISREVWIWIWLETLLQDLRYAARTLRSNPGFTTVAVTTLALGIAVNSSIFSVISGWLLTKPAIEDPDRVLAIVSTNRARGFVRRRVSAVDFLAWQAANHSFQDLAATDPFHDFTLTGGGDPQRITGMQVTANYFRMLGVSALLGRTFITGEDRPGRNRVVLLSYGLWRTRFGSDSKIAGKTVALDGNSYVVIGVMPAGYRQVAFLTRLWTPLVLPQTPNSRDQRTLALSGRLKSGVTLEQARAELAALAHRAEQNHPESEKGWSANAMTLQEYGIEEDMIRPALDLLMAAVALVLLIACANIANLLLARASKRAQEIAIRTALGAGRMRIARQLLVESLLIAALGGGAGLAAANWGIRILRSALTFNEYISQVAPNVTLDHRVLAFTCLVSICAALIFGLAPALRASAADPQTTLRHAGRSGDLRRGWGRTLLVGSQVALATVLVTGAALMIKGTADDLAGDFGYDPKRILVAAISLTNTHYHDPARQVAFFQNVVEKLRASPGVEAAGIATAVPFNAERRRFALQGRAAVTAAELPQARYFAVSPSQFRVLTIPVIQGRALRDSDTAAAAPVAVVNRAFAERFFPGQNPLGHYIRVDRDAPHWSEIVGIAGNIRGGYLEKEDDAQVYEPYLQTSLDPEMSIAVRAAGDASFLAPTLRSAVRAVDPNQPIGNLETLKSMIDQQEGGDYVFDALLAVFGAMALLLAAVGIYGVVAYTVAQRRHEIGVRMALGASSAGILRSVIARGMLLALVSAALGLAAAAPLPHLFEAMLEGYRVHSGAIFIAVPIPLLFVVLAAVYIPAARAARIDPMEALRYE